MKSRAGEPGVVVGERGASGAREPGAAHEAGLSALAERYDLNAGARARLASLLEILAHDPLAPTSVKGLESVLDAHIADSLVALGCGVVRAARAVVDIGSGAGLPGLPLAIALPDSSFTLLESSARKCRFLARAIESCRVANAEIVHLRAETFEAGRGRYDLATARAVAPLPVTAEYAAPLLRVGGSLIVWRGRREREMEIAARRAAVQLGLGEPAVQAVQPYSGAEHRHLYLLPKEAETPPRFPRRPGMAAKRPLGLRPGKRGASSDRLQR